MADDSDNDSYSSSMPSLMTVSDSSDSGDSNSSMPSLMSPRSSHDGSSVNGEETEESVDSDGGAEGVREGFRGPGAQESISVGSRGTTASLAPRVGRMLRLTARFGGIFRSRFLDERLQSDAPPTAAGAQGEQPEQFLDPVSIEFMEIGRELHQLGREQDRIEQVERRLIRRALELMRTNRWLSSDDARAEDE